MYVRLRRLGQTCRGRKEAVNGKGIDQDLVQRYDQSMVPTNRDEGTAREIAEQFQEIENAASQAQPGLNDLLQAYGAYEAVVQQEEAYFSLLNPSPVFTTKSTTGG